MKARTEDLPYTQSVCTLEQSSYTTVWNTIVTLNSGHLPRGLILMKLGGLFYLVLSFSISFDVGLGLLLLRAENPANLPLPDYVEKLVIPISEQHALNFQCIMQPMISHSNVFRLWMKVGCFARWIALCLSNDYLFWMWPSSVRNIFKLSNSLRAFVAKI